MPTQTPQTLWQQIISVLKREPKRVRLLGVLLAIIALILVRLTATGPATVNASFTGPTALSISHPLPETSSIQVNSHVLEWISQPRRPVERNLFVLPTESYSKAADGESNSPQAPTTPGDQPLHEPAQ